MWTFVRTPHFDRRLACFIRMHPDLRPRLAQVFRDLEADPFQSHLRLHPLRGELAGTYAIGITYAYRMILALSPEEQTITLLDLGSHDDVYR